VPAAQVSLRIATRAAGYVTVVTVQNNARLCALSNRPRHGSWRSFAATEVE
jgi:hypothetical protein